jgi:hypothetical protein
MECYSAILSQYIRNAYIVMLAETRSQNTAPGDYYTHQEEHPETQTYEPRPSPSNIVGTDGRKNAEILARLSAMTGLDPSKENSLSKTST